MSTDFFKYSKYDGDKLAEAASELEWATYTYVDGTDALAGNANQVISFYHVPSGKSVYFKAFITSFNETYSSDWAPEKVYGRVDPIYMFKNTTRRIALAFKVPAASEGEAFENLGRVQALIQFLYPRYSDVDEAQTISQSPLVRLKVMNLAQAETSMEENSNSSNNNFTKYKNRHDYDAKGGLLGAIGNLNVEHNLHSDDGSLAVGKNTILPKLLEINLEFNPIHETPLGWNENNEFEHLFPYGVDIADTSTKTANRTVDSEGGTNSGDGDNQANRDNGISSEMKTLDSMLATTNPKTFSTSIDGEVHDAGDVIIGDSEWWNF